MSETSFSANEKNFESLLTEGRTEYIVPSHQRDYSWETDHIESFFHDISNALEEEVSEYFIGLMVFMNGGPKKNVILDGQQRIATTTLLLSAIQRKLTELGASHSANTINEYLFFSSFRQRDLKLRLKLNSYNNLKFAQIINLYSDKDDDEIKTEYKSMPDFDHNKKLINSILCCRKLVEGLIENKSKKNEKIEVLVRFLEYLVENVRVVIFTVPNDSNAYLLFETLNDRGLALSQLDLIKNYLFGIMNDGDVENIQTQWTQITNNLNEIKPDDFLKIWWQSRHGTIRTNRIYKSFKEKYDTKPKTVNVLEDLITASSYFASLENPEDPAWGEISNESKQAIRDLDVIGAKQISSILLSALEKFEKNELEELLKVLEVFSVRYQLIGGGRTGTLESYSARIACSIFNGTILNARGVFDAFSPIYPKEDEFKLKFLSKQERIASKARYVLLKIENEERKRKHQAHAADLLPNTQLTLEHILPANPGDNWSDVIDADTQISEECLHFLGNLTLLSKVNSKIGNQSYSDKLKVFKDSQLEITKMLSGYDKWTRDAIINRQKYLWNRAKEIWKYEVC